MARLQNGSYRNHCPFCVCREHVDVVPGDRVSSCGGLMKPVGVDYRAGKGHIVVPRSRRCRFVRPNRAATDDTEALLELMRDCADSV